MRTHRQLAAWAAGITVSIATAPVSNAQDQTSTLQEVVVTGSRIRGTNLADNPVPITSLTVDEIVDSGNISLGDALSELPSLRGTFTTANSSRFIGTAGLNILDLRGLGTERTLVLVNGRRHVSSSPGAIAVDTNSISPDLLQRVDVITGGNSSVYGSDAVAGVVNFVERQDFEGLRINLQTGESSRADDQNTSVGITWGRNFLDGRANIAGSLEFGKEEAFSFSSRGSTRNMATFVTTSQDPLNSNSDGIPDSILVRNARFTIASSGGLFDPTLFFDPSGPPTTANLLRPNGLPRLFNFNHDGTLTEVNYGTRDFRANDIFTEGGDGSTLREVGDLSPDIERKSVSLLGHLDINDKLTVFGEFKAVRVNTFSLTTPTFDIFSQAFSIDNPFLTTQARTTLLSLLQPGSTVFSVGRNNVDLGARGEDTKRDTVRTVLGIRGGLTDHLNYEVSFNYGTTDIFTNVIGNRLETNFSLALDAARAADGTIQCASRLDNNGRLMVTGDPVVDACVPINVFGSGNISDAARKYVTANSTLDGRLTEQVANAFVSYDTGSWFELPGGPIGLVGGLEYRREGSAETYSPDVVNGLTFLNAIPPLDAHFSVKEAFGEARFPILKNLPAAKELSLNGSLRYADYTLQNTDTIEAWNVGLQWAPIEDVRLRGSISKSVRTPTIGDLFSPLTQNFAFVDDPCDVQNISQGSNTRAANCAAAGIPVGFVNGPVRQQTLEIRSGGNSALTEESSRSVTYGVVLQPRWIRNLQLSVDYYQIKITNVISSLSAQQILDSCYDAPSLNNIFCPLIFRDSTGLFFQGRNNPGPIGGGILQSSLNFAAMKARGIDTEIDYAFNWEKVGRFNTRFIGTYVRQRDDFPFLDAPTRPDQILGELGDPRYEFSWNLGYTRGPLSVSYKMRWIESQTIGNIEDVRSVNGQPPLNPDFADRKFTGATMYHDIRVGYQMNDSLSLYFGIDNIGDELPPLGFAGVGGGSSIYPNTGQFFYGGLNWQFAGK